MLLVNPLPGVETDGLPPSWLPVTQLTGLQIFFERMLRILLCFALLCIALHNIVLLCIAMLCLACLNTLLLTTKHAKGTFLTTKSARGNFLTMKSAQKIFLTTNTGFWALRPGTRPWRNKEPGGGEGSPRNPGPTKPGHALYFSVHALYFGQIFWNI